MRAARPEDSGPHVVVKDLTVVLDWRSISASICWRNSASRRASLSKVRPVLVEVGTLARRRACFQHPPRRTLLRNGKYGAIRRASSSPRRHISTQFKESLRGQAPNTFHSELSLPLDPQRTGLAVARVDALHVAPSQRGDELGRPLCPLRGRAAGGRDWS